MSSNHKLIIRPSSTVLDTDGEKTILESLQEQDIYIKASCGGHASCGDCSVKVIMGQEYLNEPTPEEIKLKGNVFHINNERLACQCKLKGDVTIDTSMHDQRKDAKRRKKKTSAPIKRTHVRKSDEVKAMYTERTEAREQKQKERDARDGEWEKHWEKEKDPNARKFLGGGNRPKPFIYDEEDSALAEDASTDEVTQKSTTEEVSQDRDFRKKRPKKS